VIQPRFLPAAEDELLKEVAYYSIARDDLGIRFVQEVENARSRSRRPQYGEQIEAGEKSQALKLPNVAREP
jgi:hypothetical protein